MDMAVQLPPAKPVLKWAGGKRQLLPEITRRLPLDLVKSAHIETYVEPFFGGGAVFFHLTQHFTFGRVVLNDFNPDLMLVYRVIQSQKIELLVQKLRVLEAKYVPLEHESRAAFFYAQRALYNRQKIDLDIEENIDASLTERAALTIFLNRTCFNGLYRVNSKREFNVPHGLYTNPTICNDEALLSAHRVLKDVEFRVGSYEGVDDVVSREAFVYLDPPYRPLPGTASFTDYIQKSTFGDEDQRRLAEWFRTWHHRGAFLMLSNSDPKSTDSTDDFFDSLYNGFQIGRVQAKRAINSDKHGRGLVSELLITNTQR